MDKEYFDEIITSLSKIKEVIIKSANDLKKYNYDKPEKIEEETEKDRLRHLIKDLQIREGLIIDQLENKFCDINNNIKRFTSGQTGLIMTNPKTRKGYVVYPKDGQATLFYILVLEKNLANNKICLSDYTEIEEYFKRVKCEYPQELFVF